MTEQASRAMHVTITASAQQDFGATSGKDMIKRGLPVDVNVSVAGKT